MSPRAVGGICGQEAQHIAGHSDMPKSTWAQANRRSAGQTLHVGLRDKQVFLTQMERGVSTFPKGNRGHLVFLRIPRSYRGVPEWLSVPPPAQWSLPTQSLRAVLNDFLLSVSDPGIASSASSSRSTHSPSLSSANSAAVFEMFPRARRLCLLPIHISSFY